MADKEAEPGFPSTVRIQDLYEALHGSETWVCAVRTVLGRFEPTAEVPPPPEATSLKKEPHPIPIVDGGDCKRARIQPIPQTEEF